MYWNFVAIDGVIKNQLDTQQDATPKGKNHNDGSNFRVTSYTFGPLVGICHSKVCN
jgi:hypothetical protein